ncbi:hypothetical protein LOTGIDRAFT_172876 [Lottia gigantea]|uniref:Uncharacterized protein n=1 Tax=Lottia gigantea TaxID=225164 RepID=V4AAM7_LOTGI|nr:hypothetical protein LOTGIDRAFT_172876 [Lottia gigantea]ESP01044.1 hypothetical protein LOTGIDRAFT_172876 [Lottia gigantea]
MQLKKILLKKEELYESETNLLISRTLQEVMICKLNELKEQLKQCDKSKSRWSKIATTLKPNIKTPLDWVLYSHNDHFCLLKRSEETLGIKEIEGCLIKYNQVMKSMINPAIINNLIAPSLSPKVDIVRAGGRIIKILDGIVYEENFKTPPFKDYILTLKEKRNEYKQQGNTVDSNCMKLLGNLR